MSRKSSRSLILFVFLLGLGTCYFTDNRTELQKSGQVSVEPAR